MYLHPVALLSLATFVFAYSIRKSRLVRILKTHSLHSIRARKSQKVACVCDVAFEQYRSMKKVNFLANGINKQQFINMLSSYLKKKCKVYHAPRDVDLLIVQKAVEFGYNGEHCTGW